MAWGMEQVSFIGMIVAPFTLTPVSDLAFAATQPIHVGVTNGSGVFVSGEQPLWLVASRGILVAHLMEVEGAVTDMTPFHNINCPQV